MVLGSTSTAYSNWDSVQTPLTAWEDSFGDLLKGTTTRTDFFGKVTDWADLLKETTNTASYDLGGFSQGNDD